LSRGVPPETEAPQQLVCIYCPDDDPASPEHYLSAGLGDFGPFQILNDRVGRACNNRIGERTETQFLRTGPVGFFRWIVGVEGRNGQPPPPFYRGAGGAPPVLIYGQPPDLDHEILMEAEWGTRSVHPARQIVFRDEALGVVPLLITDRMMQDSASLRPALAARGIPDAQPVRTWATAAEAAQVEALLRHAYGEIPPGLWRDDPLPPNGQVALRTVVQVSEPFFRAVAKTVFHYALKAFPDLDGASRAFHPIRDYIMEGTGNGFVRQLPYQIVGNFRAGARPTEWSHILTAERNNRSVSGTAQFFVGPESMPLPLKVWLGPNPGRVVLPRAERCAHMFILDALVDGGHHRGHVEDLDPAQRVVFL
jgi:hypothetical protein